MVCIDCVSCIACAVCSEIEEVACGRVCCWSQAKQGDLLCNTGISAPSWSTLLSEMKYYPCNACTLCKLYLSDAAHDVLPDLPEKMISSCESLGIGTLTQLLGTTCPCRPLVPHSGSNARSKQASPPCFKNVQYFLLNYPQKPCTRFSRQAQWNTLRLSQLLCLRTVA
jgi:hypothetical protein